MAIQASRIWSSNNNTITCWQQLHNQWWRPVHTCPNPVRATVNVCSHVQIQGGLLSIFVHMSRSSEVIVKLSLFTCPNPVRAIVNVCSHVQRTSEGYCQSPFTCPNPMRAIIKIVIDLPGSSSAGLVCHSQLCLSITITWFVLGFRWPCLVLVHLYAKCQPCFMIPISHCKKNLDTKAAFSPRGSKSF